jgi:zinc transporter 1
MVSRDVDYMSVADQIRKVLHEFGVHSSTIQPEFGNDDDELAEVGPTRFCRERERD